MNAISSELKARNKKANQLCLDAQIRPYCQKVSFFIYDLDNPKQDGDCTDTKDMILQDAVAALLEIEEKCKISTKINTKLIKGFVYGQRTIKFKKGNSRFKVVINSRSIRRAEWDSAKEQMNNRF